MNVKVMKEVLDEATFYLDADDRTSVYVEYKNYENVPVFEPVGSKVFRAFLGYRYREETEELAAPDFRDLLQIAIEDTLFENKNAVRIGKRLLGNLDSGGIAYYLANDTADVVGVTKDGWTVQPRQKIKFLRRSIDLEQVMPVAGGDLLKLLRPYVNMTQDDFMLFVVFLVHAFCRDSSHFVAIISSDKGSGKSSLSKVVRALVDPSKVQTSFLPANENDLKTTLANSYLACFDNLTKISPQFSDIFCSAVTGATTVKRQLYTDSDLVTLDLHNLLVLNGINILPNRSDLLERSLVFHLKKIPKDKRRSDSDFWQSFEKDRPYILGAIFDVLTKALSFYDRDLVEKKHRMADAHLEMAAIALALGMTMEDFSRIFWENCEKASEAYAEQNLVVEWIACFMEGKTKVSDTSTKVYEKVYLSAAGDRSLFPKSASTFTRRLNEEKDALKKAGFVVNQDKRADANILEIKRIPISQRTKTNR